MVRVERGERVNQIKNFVELFKLHEIVEHTRRNTVGDTGKDEIASDIAALHRQGSDVIATVAHNIRREMRIKPLMALITLSEAARVKWPRIKCGPNALVVRKTVRPIDGKTSESRHQCIEHWRWRPTIYKIY